MQKRLITLLAVALCGCNILKAAPDSTKTSNAADEFLAPATIFGIFDPLQLNVNGNERFFFVPYADFYTASDCFTTRFIQNFFGSGFVTEEIKNDASSRLSDLNTIGIDFNSGLWMMVRSKKDPHNFFIAGIDYNFEESSRFTDDLFHVVMYGNYDLQGITSDFSDSKFSLTSTMEYKAGFMKLMDQGYNQYKFGFTGGFVQGLSGMDIKVQNTTMFTAEDGRYLDLDYDFRIYTAGKNKPSLTALNGAGFSADIFGSAYFQGPEIGINLLVNDIGVVFWDKDPFKISADSAIRFEGISIDNLFAATDSTIAGQSDSLLEILGVIKEENVFSQALPSRLNFSATKYWKDAGSFFTLGMQYIFNAPYSPLIFAQGGKTFKNSELTLAINAHVGGYGDYNAGIDITKSIFDHVQLKIGSNSLLGILAPDSFTGAAGYASAVVKF